MPRRARQPTLPVDGSRIGVLGLGYVGLPLALAFGERFPTTGFDIDPVRVEELRSGRDRSQAVLDNDIYYNRRVAFTADLDDLRGSDVLIVTVPTLIDERKRPDLTALKAASRMVGEVLEPGGLVIFESTVYPGATEEVCVPLIEEASGLRYNWHFFVGYSPERLNPGDAFHRLADVVKITSGSTPRTAKFVQALYGEIIEAGTFPVADMRTAEAAKIIENTQRDINIALVNEFAMIFDRLGIDTGAVLEAAGTKWNFLSCTPGLVGGHCIGVDPYYLTHKAEEAGHRTELILAGRRINDAMADYVAGRVVGLMKERGIPPAGSRILVLGLTFKENCPDVRNTKVVDLVRALEGHGAEVVVHDPWVHADDVPDGIRLIGKPEPGRYDAIIGAVRHIDFIDVPAKPIRAYGRSPCVVFDVKQLWPADLSDGRL